MKPVMAAIYTKLGSVQTAGTFHALLQGRYYHMEAPQNTGYPLCVYRMLDVANDNRFSGSRILRGIVQFVTFVEAKVGADAAMDIDEALFTLLDQQELAVSGSTYGAATLQCIMRGVPFATDEFIVLTSTYSLFTTRIP